jgi:hypothetical protein
MRKEILFLSKEKLPQNRREIFHKIPSLFKKRKNRFQGPSIGEDSPETCSLNPSVIFRF